MTVDELAQFRELLRAQAAAPPRVGLAGRLRALRGRRGGLELGAVDISAEPLEPPPIHAPLVDARFGRRALETAARRPDPETGATGVLVLATPLKVGCAPPRVHLPIRPGEIMRTPCQPEDLVGPQWSTIAAPAPGAIAGWSAQPPPSARSRLLSRVAAVCDAERRGLEARRQALHVAA